MTTMSFLIAVLSVVAVRAQSIEIHHVLDLPSAEDKTVALTLDACGGAYDADILELLIKRRVPATIFATRRWLNRHPEAVAVLNAHRDLFDVEDHGARHVPAVIGVGRKVWGMPGSPDMAHLEREVIGGAKAVEAATGQPPRWYRGAGGEYDPQALQAIERLGLRVAGFSLNADDGARLNREQVIRRLRRARNGDIIIAHMNRPDSDTAEGLAIGIRSLLDLGFRFVTLREARLRPAAKAQRAQAASEGESEVAPLPFSS